MKLKRIALLLLSLVMVLSSVVAVPLSIGATEATEPEVTGANPDTAGYKAENVVEITAATIAAEGATSVTMTQYVGNTPAGIRDAKYISISTPAELALFSQSVNDLKPEINDTTGCYTEYGYNCGDYTGKIIYLTADIDMTGVTMFPIGVRAQSGGNYVRGQAFRGTFDGQGYAISNLVINGNEVSAKLPDYDKVAEGENAGKPVDTADRATYGLFGALYGKATVRNVVLDDTCSITANQGWESVGGLVGLDMIDDGKSATIENCYVAATVTNETAAAGGVIGRGQGHVVATGITFAGSVTSAAHTGGFLSYNDSGFTFKNCVSDGTVTSKGNIAGGFASRYDGGPNSTFENCINYSSVRAEGFSDTLLVAGFVGRVLANATPTETTGTLTIKDLTNEGRVSVAYSTRNVFVDNFYNLGDVPVWRSNVAKTTVVATNCKGVQLEAGYNPGLIKVVDKADMGTKITSETTPAEITAGTTFYIEDADGLVRLSVLINELSDQTNGLFNGKTVYLAADIDMKNVKNFIPIGTRSSTTTAVGGVANGLKWNSDGTDYEVITGSGNQYNANGLTFDGQGHSIKNLEIVTKSYKVMGAGLFGYSTAKVVRNLIMDESCYVASLDSNYDLAGAFAGYNGATAFTNCLNMANVYAKDGYAGGISGGGPGGNGAAGTGPLNGAYFCTNLGTIRGIRAAGAHGGRDDGGTTMNCINAGTIVGFGGFAAGLINNSRGGCQIRNNINAGSVMNNYAAGCAAGVAYIANDGADVYQLEIRNNYNYGAVASSTNSVWAYEGGVVAYPATKKENADKASIDDLYEKVVSGTQLFTVWGNFDETPFIGYNAEGFMPISATTMNGIPDIKNAWTIIPGDGENGVRLSPLFRGDAPKTLKITDAEGMRVLSAVVYSGNKLADTTIYLANDIDMSSLKFNLADTDFAEQDTFFPIGWYNGNNVISPTPVSGANEVGSHQPDPTPEKPNQTKYVNDPLYTGSYFSGNFDGQGHKIYNWTIDQEEVVAGGNGLRVGLFGLIYQATVQNLVFDSTNKITGKTDVGAGRWTGVVVEATASMINNVYNKADWDYLAADSGTTGGIVAYATASGIANCTNDGDLIGTRGVGGIVGWSANSCGITNCRNNGEVKSTFVDAANTKELNQVGGIVGRVGGRGYIWDEPGYARVTRILSCVNNGGVYSVAEGSYVGSFAGFFVTGPDDTVAQLRVGNSHDYANPNLAAFGVPNIGINSNCFYFCNIPEGDWMLDTMLDPSIQLKEGEEDGTYDVRLIATLDDYDNYQKAGFLVSVDGADAVEYVTYEAWASLQAEIAGEDEPVVYNPADIGDVTARSFFVQVLEGVEEGAAIEVQAFAVTKDGTVLKGYQDNFYIADH